RRRRRLALTGKARRTQNGNPRTSHYPCSGWRGQVTRSITRYSPSSYTIEGTGSLHRRNRDVPPFNVSALWQHLEVRDGEHLTTDKILRPKSRRTVSGRIRRR